MNDLAMDDWQLLNEYATRNSEAAFRALVDRYGAMVYHAALRQLRSPHQAEEVAQAVFIALAQKASSIPRRTILCGWLFRATRFAVLKLLRDDACRRRYETQAMDSITPSTEADIWQQIAPHLDEALERLSRADREIIMVRFFGSKSHREVARALGITEVTAKKRLSRALEKLRVIFARRGLAVPGVALTAAFCAFGSQAAPAGLTSSITAAALAHGAAGATTGFSIAKAILQLMAWAKAKTALSIGAGVLLAAGTATVVGFKAAASAPDDLIARLEHQSGKRIAWDKHLVLPADADFSGVPLEQALDQLAVQADAYWTVDYAVYDSDAALQRLLDVLHGGATLESGGWTNLSAMPLQPQVNVVPFDPHGRLHTFMRIPKDHPRDRVGMIVVLGPDADPTLLPPQPEGDPGQMHIMRGPPPNGPAAQRIRAAMDDGMAEGVLAPERLLAEASLVPAMQPLLPESATAETAARLARSAHARWTTIYTLRKSPLTGAGIKLVHTGMESAYGPANLPGSPDAMVGGLQSGRFNLSPEDRAAHQRAVEQWKKQH